MDIQRKKLTKGRKKWQLRQWESDFLIANCKENTAKWIGRTIASTNAREHWAMRAKRAKRERASACIQGLSISRRGMKLPIKVTFTRYGPKVLDTDNILSALKALRDGIADAFGVDDSKGSGIEWEYAEQVKTKPGQHAVLIEITSLGGQPDE